MATIDTVKVEVPKELIDWLRNQAEHELRCWSASRDYYARADKIVAYQALLKSLKELD